MNNTESIRAKFATIFKMVVDLRCPHCKMLISTSIGKHVEPTCVSFEKDSDIRYADGAKSKKYMCASLYGNCPVCGQRFEFDVAVKEVSK